MQFYDVFFTILCFHNINNYYYFYLSLEFPGRPKGALINKSRSFWQIFKEKKKRIAYYVISGGIFTGIFRKSLLT